MAISDKTTSSVAVFRVFELSLAADGPGSMPYADGPEVKATFLGVSGAAAGKSLVVQGFWDGGNLWKIRFAPTYTGEWTYTTSSSDPGLDRQSGRLTAVPPSPVELAENPLLHGFLEADGHAWRLSDGTPFLPVGDTNWAFSEEVTSAEWERWMKARQGQGFNTFLGSVWLAKYDRAEATQPPFPQQDPQSDALNVAYFQRLDEMVAFANARGILMGLSIGGFPDNSRWFERFGSRERNDRWFRYVVARYAAYNVRWMLYGEANEADPPWGTSWEEEVAHSARLVKEEDPYDHPLGNHHTDVDTRSAENPDIDYLEVQSKRTQEQYEVALGLRKYGKPIWYEEYWYEPEAYDGEVNLGIRNTYRNFVAALAFPTMGSLMRAHYHEGRDLEQVESDPGAVRMCYFGKFFGGLALDRFSPAADKVDRGQAGRFGQDYALFVEGGGRVALDLSGESGSYLLRRLDIHTGEVLSLGSLEGGGVRMIDTGSSGDSALLITAQGGLLPDDDAYLLFFPNIFHSALPGFDSGVSSCNF